MSVEPLHIVRDGHRYGVRGGGVTWWLPATLWAHAEALQARMDAMNAVAEHVERLYRDAENAAWEDAGAKVVSQ